MNLEQINFTQYKTDNAKGHYESFFLRANHPSRPVAFWIRYTIFSPKNNNKNAIAELWAIWFDREKNIHTVVKKEVPFSKALFSHDKFNVNIEDASLSEGHLAGSMSQGSNSLKWDLNYNGGQGPLLALPSDLYHKGLPKAKLLVGKPLAVFNGTISVNGEDFSIENWTGSQNHNWGVKHTDHYAWGQVAGFDNYPDSFLEVATARLKLGPVWTPYMTILVLRHNGHEYRLNTIPKALQAKAFFNYFDWNFSTGNKEINISGNIHAEKKDFVGLKYYNPPGGIKHCLNSKIASAEIKISFINGKEDVLKTSSRAAFEILTDDTLHGMPLMA
jgi:hypothetical protein